MMRLLFFAAAVGLVGIVSVPFLLSRRLSDTSRYKEELAQWHVRWADSGSPEEKAELLPDLERIRPPVASVSGVNRHRQYVQAHELVVLAEDATEGLLTRVNEWIGGDGPRSPFGCETLPVYVDQAERIARETGVQLEWIASSCDVLSAARIHLADVRSDALTGWLKDEIEDLRANGPD